MELRIIGSMMQQLYAMMKILALIIIIYICIVNVVYAFGEDEGNSNSDSIESEIQQEVIMTAVPRRCVKPASQEYCSAEIHIKWEAIIPSSYCLYINSEEEPQACWKEQVQGILVREFYSTDQELYVLKSEDGTKIVNKVIVNVVTSSNRQKRSSNYRKKLWRVFR